MHDVAVQKHVRHDGCVPCDLSSRELEAELSVIARRNESGRIDEPGVRLGERNERPMCTATIRPMK